MEMTAHQWQFNTWGLESTSGINALDCPPITASYSRPHFTLLSDAKPVAETSNRSNSNPAEYFGREIEENRQEFRDALGPKKDGRRLEYVLADCSDEEIITRIHTLRNSVGLHGIDALVAAYEASKKIQPMSIQQHGHHMIRRFAGLQSPMIAKKDFEKLIEADPPYAVRRAGAAEVIGTYLYTTQISTPDEGPTPQEEVLFGKGGMEQLLQDRILTHNPIEDKNLARILTAQRDKTLAYFATVCVANDSRGESIGTLLKYLTYKRASESLLNNGALSTPLGLQRYFSIAGIYERKTGRSKSGMGDDDVIPVHEFNPPIQNTASAVLNAGTYNHVGTERAYESVLRMVTNNYSADQTRLVALNNLGIGPEKLENLFVGIDNMYVIIELERAIERFRQTLERKGLGYLL